jgi:DNA-binding LacI/PurR family transcriptional regulator
MKAPNQGESPARGDDGEGEERVPLKMGDLQKTITMAQIAKAAGVSQGAISSLLNDRDYGIRVSEKTRERVFKVCREMGYIPNDLRAVVRMYPELGDFCLLLTTRRPSGVGDPFLSRIAAATMEALPPSSRGLSIGCYEEKTDYSDADQLPHPVQLGVASKFLIYGAANTTLIQALLRRGWPVLCLGYDVPIPGVLSLVPDYEQASRIAVEHLFGLGHRHIAMDAQNIVYGDLTQQDGVTAFTTLIERKPEPTAVFCMSDAAAAGVLAAAYSHGRRVPEELSIVGCSDDLFTHMTCPALTTVHLPAEEMATGGVKEIDRLMREGPPDDPIRRVFPVRLVERQSCSAITVAARA